MSTTSDKKETNAPAATDVISTGFPQDNETLKAKYDEMHSQGPSAWFSDGKEERELILDVGQPWNGLKVLEIGCGEGELAEKMFKAGAFVTGLDYSEAAMAKAQFQYLGPFFVCADWQQAEGEFDRVVMQGVLEHLDNPFASLDAACESSSK